MQKDVLQLIGSAIQSQIAGARAESTAGGTRLVSSVQRGTAIIVTARDAGGVSTQFMVYCAPLNPAPPAATEGSQDESATTAAKASETEVPADAGEATEATEAAETDVECGGTESVAPHDSEADVSNPEPQPASDAETPDVPKETLPLTG